MRSTLTAGELAVKGNRYTVEPRYNEVLGTVKITLLYPVSHYIRVKKTKKYKVLGPAILPCYFLRGLCYIRPLYNEVPLYCIHIYMYYLMLMAVFLKGD